MGLNSPKKRFQMRLGLGRLISLNIIPILNLHFHQTFRVQRHKNIKSEESHDGMMGAKIPPNMFQALQTKHRVLPFPHFACPK